MLILIIIMKKINATISDESYTILEEYRDDMMLGNLDTALDMFLKDHEKCKLSIGVLRDKI